MKTIILILGIITMSPLNQENTKVEVPMTRAVPGHNVTIKNYSGVDAPGFTYNASGIYSSSNKGVNVYGGAGGMNISDMQTKQTSVINSSTSQTIAYGPGHTTGQDECYCGAKASDSNNKNVPPCNCGHWHWNGRWVHIADGQCPHNPDSKNYNAPIGNGVAIMIILALVYALFCIVKREAKLDIEED